MKNKCLSEKNKSFSDRHFQTGIKYKPQPCLSEKYTRKAAKTTVFLL